MRVFARNKNWAPNVYVVTQATIVPEIIDSAYYKIFRTIDNLDVIPYNTGSFNATKLSYDVSGNYFNLDTSCLQAGYSYGIKFTYQRHGDYVEQPEIFKFRLIDEDST